MRTVLLGSLLLLGTAASSSAGAAEPAGSILGRVTYLGRPPHVKAVPVTKDSAVCGKTRVEDTWTVAEDGGVANVVVYLVGAATGKPWTGNAHPTLDQVGCHYLPHVQVVPVHSVLQVKSEDPVLHNVHGFFSGSTAINFAMPPHGPVLSKRLDKPGGIQLKCDVHSFMRGAIFVADNPYSALTGPDGSFEIRDVPPGHYTIATWHEEGGPVTEKIEVQAGQQVHWSARVR